MRFGRSVETHVARLPLVCCVICLRTLRRFCRSQSTADTDSEPIAAKSTPTPNGAPMGFGLPQAGHRSGFQVSDPGVSPRFSCSIALLQLIINCRHLNYVHNCCQHDTRIDMMLLPSKSAAPRAIMWPPGSTSARPVST